LINYKSKIKSSQIKKNPRSHDQIITSPKRIKSSQDPELQRQRNGEHSAKIQRIATSRVENAS
jgi:hypothetical protein